MFIVYLHVHVRLNSKSLFYLFFAKELVLALLDWDDGRDGICNVAVQIAQYAKAGKQNASDLSLQKLNHLLSGLLLYYILCIYYVYIYIYIYIGIGIGIDIDICV